MWGDGNFLAPKNLIKHFKNFWSQKNLIKHPYEKVDAWVTFIFYWLLKHPEYIFKIAPIKNTFLETVFSKNINLIYSIYSSSESSEELSKSSICLITFFWIYLQSMGRILNTESKLITDKQVWLQSTFRISLL